MFRLWGPPMISVTYYFSFACCDFYKYLKMQKLCLAMQTQATGQSLPTLALHPSKCIKAGIVQIKNGRNDFFFHSEDPLILSVKFYLATGAGIAFKNILYPCLSTSALLLKVVLADDGTNKPKMSQVATCKKSLFSPNRREDGQGLSFHTDLQEPKLIEDQPG